MLPMVLALSLLSGQARDAGTPWPFVGTSPVMRPGPPAGSGVLARYLNLSGGVASSYGVTFTRASAGAACTASDGTVTFPAVDVPCLAGGYHARPQIPNLLTQTDAFDNAAWSKSSGITVTANSTAAPDGTTTGDTLSSDGSGASLSVLQSITSDGSAYTISGWGKAGTSAAGILRIFDSTGVVELCHSSAASSSSWTRLSCTTAATTSGNTIAFRVYPVGTGTAVGNSVWWGLQVVAGSLPLDYCPSGSTPATCAAEVATVPTPGGMSLTSGCAKVCVTPTWTGDAPGGGEYVVGANAARFAYVASGTLGNVTGYDGASFPAVTASNSVGVRGCYLSQWSASGGYFRLTNLATATVGMDVAFTGFGAFDSTVHIGALVDGTEQPFGAVLDSIVLGSSPGACQ